MKLFLMVGTTLMVILIAVCCLCRQNYPIAQTDAIGITSGLSNPNANAHGQVWYTERLVSITFNDLGQIISEYEVTEHRQ